MGHSTPADNPGFRFPASGNVSPGPASVSKPPADLTALCWRHAVTPRGLLLHAAGAHAVLWPPACYPHRLRLAVGLFSSPRVPQGLAAVAGKCGRATAETIACFDSPVPHWRRGHCLCQRLQV